MQSDSIEIQVTPFVQGLIGEMMTQFNEMLKLYKTMFEGDEDSPKMPVSIDETALYRIAINFLGFGLQEANMGNQQLQKLLFTLLEETLNQDIDHMSNKMNDTGDEE